MRGDREVMFEDFLAIVICSGAEANWCEWWIANMQRPAWHRQRELRRLELAGRRTGCLAPIWAPCLLASDRASHRVPGTDLGPLFASIRPGLAPGAWHRFGPPVC